MTYIPKRQTMHFKATKDAPESFDCKTITDRLRTVCWNENRHPAGVVNLRFWVPLFPLPLPVVQSKEPPCLGQGPTNTPRLRGHKNLTHKCW